MGLAGVSSCNAFAGMTNTGRSEWRTTLSVTLPNTHRLMPERPWVHMAIKLPGFAAASTISCAAGLSEACDDISTHPKGALKNNITQAG